MHARHAYSSTARIMALQLHTPSITSALTPLRPQARNRFLRSRTPSTAEFMGQKNVRRRGECGGVPRGLREDVRHQGMLNGVPIHLVPARVNTFICMQAHVGKEGLQFLYSFHASADGIH